MTTQFAKSYSCTIEFKSGVKVVIEPHTLGFFHFPSMYFVLAGNDNTDPRIYEWQY